MLFFYPGYLKLVDRKKHIIVSTKPHLNVPSINTYIQYMKEQNLVVLIVSIKQDIRANLVSTYTQYMKI